MSENVLEQIDCSKDWNIDMKEIQVSLDTGFFDKEANRTLLQDEFNKPIFEPGKTGLKNSFKNSLTSAKNDIAQKIRQNKPLTSAEIKIIKLDAVISDKAVYTDVNFKQNDRKKDVQVMLFVTKINPAYQQNMLQKKPLINSTSMENKELSPTERKVQIETILYAGQYYMQFLQNKGVLQPKYEGDKPQHLIYFNELQSKYTNGENINDEMIKFYIQQIFADISSAGSFSQKAGDAYQGIVTILTTKEGRNTKNKNNKMIDVLYQIRQLDDAKGITYVSGDMLLDVSLKNIGTCKLQRGPESRKLNAALAQLKVLKPLPNGEFADSMVKTMYQKLKNPSKDILVDNKSQYATYGDKDIFAVLKKYNLPSKGASNQELFDLQLDLVRQVNTMKTQENKQKASIQQAIIAEKVKEITAQKQQKELLKQEFIKQKIDLNNSEVQKTLAYFDQQAAMYTVLLNGGSIVMETATGNKDITLSMIIDQQYISMETTLMSDILQKSTIYHILDQNSNTINFIRDIKKSGSPLTTDEKTIDMLSDITGAGDYRSDKNFNTAVEVTKELVIQVALLAISGGIANIAAKGTLLAIQSGAKFLKMGSYVARVARYTNMSKTAFWSSVRMMPELFAADIIAEGSVFHLVNTTLNTPFQRLGSEEYFKTINPFSSEGAMGYLESSAFMGIMKGFGSLTNQITKELGGETLTVVQQSARIKNILTAHAITLPGEVMAMQGTSVAIALSFGHDVDLTPQSRAHTIALVIGLRLAHNVTSPIKKVSDNIEGKIQQNSMQQGEIKIDNVFYDKQGNVQSVQYRVIDGTGKEIDAGVASQATIDAAMKNKQAEQTKMKEKEITRINNLSQKPFTEITLQDRYDMGFKQQREYIKKNELWKDKSLSTEEVNKKKVEDLTVEEFGSLVEKIREKKGETKSVIDQKPVEEKEVPKVEETKIIRDKEGHGTEKIEGEGLIIEKDGEFLLTDKSKEIINDTNTNPNPFNFKIKQGNSEYTVIKDWNSNERNIRHKVVFDSNGKVEKLVGKDFLLGSHGVGNIHLQDISSEYNISGNTKIEVGGFVYNWNPAVKNITESLGIKYNEKGEILEIKSDLIKKEGEVIKEYKIDQKLQDILANVVGNEMVIIDGHKKYVVTKDAKTKERGVTYVEVDNGTNYHDEREVVWMNQIKENTPIKFVEVTEFSSNFQKGVIEYIENKKALEIELNAWDLQEGVYRIIYQKFVRSLGRQHDWRMLSTRGGDGGVINNIYGEYGSEAKPSRPKKTPQGNFFDVRENADLQNGPRLQKAEELLGKEFTGKLIKPDGKFTQLGQKILDAHNNSKGGEVYKITPEQLIEKTRILDKAGFKSNEIRILMENGICGKVEHGDVMIQRKIKTDNFDFPMKKGKVEYQKTNPDGTTQEASLGEITIQQAKECFLNGLSVSADIFKGQNRAVLSSGSLFLNVEGYKKLGGDIDIATDVQTFINLVLKKTNGLTELDRFVKAGTIQDLIFTKINHTKIDITKLTDKEINDYIDKGDIRVEFNIKSKDGFLINIEFFPEPKGYGLIQLGTKRTRGKIKECTINGKKIRTVDEDLAAKSYLVNLAHEIENNSLEGLSKGEKIKDSIRINNIFEHLVSLGIKVPKDMIGFIEKTISDYKDQPGSDGGMCKYLEDGLLGLEKTKEIFKDINNDYNIVKENSVNRGTETTIPFNEFINRTYEIKKELLDIQKNGQNIPDKVYSEIIELQKKVSIKDPQSFAYYYELYQLRSNFIKPISNKL